MLARFAPHRETPGSISLRIQTALHGFTNLSVFILDALTDGDTGAVAFARSLGHIRKVEIKNHFSLIHATGNNKIRVHRAFVAVDHEIRIEPVIKRTLAFAHRARLCFGAFVDDWARLQTKPRAVLNLVIAIVEHAVESL